MLTLVFWHGAWCYGFKCKQANKHRTEKQSPGFTFTLCIMSKCNNTTLEFSPLYLKIHSTVSSRTFQEFSSTVEKRNRNRKSIKQKLIHFST